MRTSRIDLPIPAPGASPAVIGRVRRAVQDLMDVLDQLPKDFAMNRALIQLEQIGMALEESLK